MPPEPQIPLGYRGARAGFLTCLKVAAVVSILVLATPPAHAQASVTGTVSDEEGEPVIGAKIVLTALVGSPLQLKAKTLKKGKYRVILPQNKYDFLFTIEKEGFHTFREEIRFGQLRLGDRSTLRNFTLLTLAGARRQALAQAAAGRELKGIKPAAQEAYNQGAGLYNSGDLEGARDKFQKALNEDPAIAPALRILMSIYYRLEDFEAAARSARELLEAAPDHREALEIERDSCRSMNDEACAQKAQSRLDALP